MSKKDMLGPAVRNLVALPSDALGTATDLLDKMANPGWTEAVKHFLRKEEIVWREFLRPVGEFTLSARKETLDPQVRLRTREGLWVSPYFQDNVLKYANTLENTPEIKLESFELIKSANDLEIMGELPLDPMDVDTTCVALAQMIDRQPGGEEGFLLINGRWNIFYAQVGGEEVYMLYIYRDYGRKEWRIYAFPLRKIRWSKDCRVLCTTA